MQEKEYINQNIADRSKETAAANSKTKDEIKYEKDSKRKQIFVQYANLKPAITFDKLNEMVIKFQNLNEEQQRNVFKSIKIGHTQELAKIELYRDDKDLNKTS